MLIPSIDISGGRCVQLRQGRQLVIDAGDPRPIAEKFAPLGEIAVIDLDAAMSTGSNADLIRELLPIARCRVGGGIRDVHSARSWLDAGASRIILGTAAKPEVLAQLPRDRVIAALDARDGEIVVEGWQRGTGRQILPSIEQLRDLVSGFLITFVEIEGTMSGFNAERARPFIDAAGAARVTIAGGITTAADIRALDSLGADAQVGMAIYSGKLDLTDAFAAPLTSDRPDGLWPTVVTDTRGVALGLAYSNAESLRTAIKERRGVYWSRNRGLWRKGESSGATQRLRRIDLDCDRDALRFTVEQSDPGFCHNGTRTCWGAATGLAALEPRLRTTLAENDPNSYTAKLARDPGLLRSKLVEEAAELADARDPAHIAEEAADLLYFALARLAAANVPLSAAELVLDRRALRLTRRPGLAKPTTPEP